MVVHTGVDPVTYPLSRDCSANHELMDNGWVRGILTPTRNFRGFHANITLGPNKLALGDGIAPSSQVSKTFVINFYTNPEWL